MNAVSADSIRDLLRKVPYPGFSRDIVTAGFVKEVVADEAGVLVRFAPNSTNTKKVAEMEAGIRAALTEAEIRPLRIVTVLPFAEAEMVLRKVSRGGEEKARSPIVAEADSDADIDRSMTGPNMMNPLQAELLEEGLVGEPDVLRNDITDPGNRPDGHPGIEPPRPFDGPIAAGTTYEGELPVFQWDIDPHDSAAESVETSVRIPEWEIRVWWQVHPKGGLYYASLQALREDWADHNGAASKHPVGRTAAVNLVYDQTRNAVVAIYGTVRDFRPFVEAFRRALLDHGKPASATSSEDTTS
jgi:hypothetical protein